MEGEIVHGNIELSRQLTFHCQIHDGRWRCELGKGVQQISWTEAEKVSLLCNRVCWEVEVNLCS